MFRPRLVRSRSGGRGARFVNRSRSTERGCFEERKSSVDDYESSDESVDDVEVTSDTEKPDSRPLKRRLVRSYEDIDTPGDENLVEGKEGEKVQYFSSSFCKEIERQQLGGGNLAPAWNSSDGMMSHLGRQKIGLTSERAMQSTIEKSAGIARFLDLHKRGIVMPYDPVDTKANGEVKRIQLPVKYYADPRGMLDKFHGNRVGKSVDDLIKTVIEMQTKERAQNALFSEEATFLKACAGRIASVLSLLNKHYLLNAGILEARGEVNTETIAASQQIYQDLLSYAEEDLVSMQKIFSTRNFDKDEAYLKQVLNQHSKRLHYRPVGESKGDPHVEGLSVERVEKKSYTFSKKNGQFIKKAQNMRFEVGNQNPRVKGGESNLRGGRQNNHGRKRKYVERRNFQPRQPFGFQGFQRQRGFGNNRNWGGQKEWGRKRPHESSNNSQPRKRRRGNQMTKFTNQGN